MQYSRVFLLFVLVFYPTAVYASESELQLSELTGPSSPTKVGTPSSVGSPSSFQVAFRVEEDGSSDTVPLDSCYKTLFTFMLIGAAANLPWSYFVKTIYFDELFYPTEYVKSYSTYFAIANRGSQLLTYFIYAGLAIRYKPNFSASLGSFQMTPQKHVRAIKYALLFHILIMFIVSMTPLWAKPEASGRQSFIALTMLTALTGCVNGVLNAAIVIVSNYLPKKHKRYQWVITFGSALGSLIASCAYWSSASAIGNVDRSSKDSIERFAKQSVGYLVSCIFLIFIIFLFTAKSGGLHTEFLRHYFAHPPGPSSSSARDRTPTKEGSSLETEGRSRKKKKGPEIVSRWNALKFIGLNAWTLAYLGLTVWANVGYHSVVPYVYKNMIATGDQRQREFVPYVFFLDSIGSIGGKFISFFFLSFDFGAAVSKIINMFALFVTPSFGAYALFKYRVQNPASDANTSATGANISSFIHTRGGEQIFMSSFSNTLPAEDTQATYLETVGQVAASALLRAFRVCSAICSYFSSGFSLWPVNSSSNMTALPPQDGDTELPIYYIGRKLMGSNGTDFGFDYGNSTSNTTNTTSGTNTTNVTSSNMTNVTSSNMTNVTSSNMTNVTSSNTTNITSSNTTNGTVSPNGTIVAPGSTGTVEPSSNVTEPAPQLPDFVPDSRPNSISNEDAQAVVPVATTYAGCITSLVAVSGMLHVSVEDPARQSIADAGELIAMMIGSFAQIYFVVNH